MRFILVWVTPFQWNINEKIRSRNATMYLWHHQLHERKLGESLAYFQLSFVPVYRQEKISTTFLKLLSEHKISSYCIYEIYGLYDILMRVWLPMGLPAPRFARILSDALRNLGCTRVLPFFVSRHVHHWKWWSDHGMLSPACEHVEAIDDQHIKMVESGSSSPELVSRLERQHLLRPYDSDGSALRGGIKFFVVIPPPQLGVVPAEDMQDKICEWLRGLLASSKDIVEPSMYMGDGFAWLLIKAKMPFTSYCAVDDLIQKINEMGVEGYYIRTYTYLATGSPEPFTIERECLSRTDTALLKPATMDIASFLSQGENEKFEVKASVKFDFARFVHDKSHPVTQSERLAVEGVLKTIVAFLNTQGGDLLIGAVEKHRFEKEMAESGSGLAGFPVVGEWLVCGINDEYTFTKNLDGFRLMLTDLIRSHIGADASALVSIDPVAYQGRDLAIVRVPKGLGWYYLDNEKFYVRRSGSTIALDGVERERYQKSNSPGGA